MSELIDGQALRAAHGLGSDCHDCKRDMKSCQYDRDYSLMDFCEWLDDAPTASPWHRVEEPPKDACDCLVCWTTIHDEETGEVTGHGFWCEKGWYEDGLLGEVGFYCQRREETHPVRVEPDYWMPIEPPKEDA